MRNLELRPAVAKKLLDDKGFALVETIVALAILSFALVGLMIMVQYARARAIANYHDRYVLLRVDGELQRIRYHRTYWGGFPLLLPVEFDIPQQTTARNPRPIRVTVHFKHDFNFDSTVGFDVGFESIIATAEWNEHVPFFSRRPIRPERRFILLREDYYMRRIGL
jgi:prepilin-type N-terminal cleavage/methylation domain-containing protein